MVFKIFDLLVMIISKVQGDIFASNQKHIAFAVSTDGFNDTGFAGQVSCLIWPDIARTGGNELGEVLTHHTPEKTYHALVCVCHDQGWGITHLILSHCLDKIEAPVDEEIAIVLMGSGWFGKKFNVDVNKILSSMENSSRKLVVYTR